MPGQRLRIMSYNIQVGISTRHPHQYFTHSWKHVLPHSQRLVNLDRTAHLLKGYDIVGLQEVDAGSLRSNYINLTEYLAVEAGMPFWYHQVNRNLGRFAQHSNGLLSRYQPQEMRNITLPGLIPGRNAILARYGTQDASLGVFIVHLALSKRARLRQLSHLSEVINEFDHAIFMGDLNCRASSAELKLLFTRTRLREPLEETLTFPSWRPRLHIDHIFVTPEIHVHKVHSLSSHPYSDHLPIAMEIDLPENIRMRTLAA